MIIIQLLVQLPDHHGQAGQHQLGLAHVHAHVHALASAHRHLRRLPRLQLHLHEIFFLEEEVAEPVVIGRGEVDVQEVE